MRQCSVEGCTKIHMGKGFCRVHYGRWKRTGSPLIINHPKGLYKHCTVASCAKSHHGKGFCSPHLQAFMKWGDPLINKAYNYTKEQKIQGRKRSKEIYKKKRLERLKICTPKWANIFEIIKMYKNCPRGLCVDHIVPIFGENVCGLHVENNLQYLDKRENSRKGNRCI